MISPFPKQTLWFDKLCTSFFFNPEKKKKGRRKKWKKKLKSGLLSKHVKTKPFLRHCRCLETLSKLNEELLSVRPLTSRSN